ncbi:Stage V sporulation protein S [compost metagenome]
MTTTNNTAPGLGDDFLKCAAHTEPAKLAGAIAGCVREKGRAEVQAIGAGAVNQAVKAIGIARGYVAPGGINLIAIPAFLDVEIGGEERTTIRFIIEPR